MKTCIYSILFLIFAILPLSAAPRFDDGDTEAGEEEIIILVETNEGTLPGFRGPAAIPVEAFYSEMYSRVNVVFVVNIGEVTVRLTNLMTNSVTQIVVESSAGTCFVPVTGGYGFYRIEFVTTNGTTYYGYFNDNYSLSL